MKPYYEDQAVTIYHGDCRVALKGVPEASVQCVVTSPPYWGLRSYLKKGDPDKHLEIGAEKTPQEYVKTLVNLFREVRRVLKDDGTVWLNLGDCYAGSGKGMNSDGTHSGGLKQATNAGTLTAPVMPLLGEPAGASDETGSVLKAKDLIGIPWRVALALQADGWWLRSDIIWAKPNCMPESVTDRPTRSHEYIFLLSKSQNYFYDHEAIKEPASYDVDGTGTAARKARVRENLKSHPTGERAGIRPAGYKNSVNFDGKNNGNEKQRGQGRRHEGFNDRWDAMEKEEQCTGMRNKRDVWTVSPAQFREAHFAVFPPALIQPCILAGSHPGDMVFDPFAGSGTTGMVALELGRRFLGCELNAEYLPMLKRRMAITPGLPLGERPGASGKGDASHA